jgi:hypothetical protein
MGTADSDTAIETTGYLAVREAQVVPLVVAVRFSAIGGMEAGQLVRTSRRNQARMEAPRRHLPFFRVPDNALRLCLLPWCFGMFEKPKPAAFHHQGPISRRTQACTGSKLALCSIPTVRCSEGLAMGYRWYDSKQIAPLLPFGYGLSYTTFAISKLEVTPRSYHWTHPIQVMFFVENIGTRSGAEVAHVYVGHAGQFGRATETRARISRGVPEAWQETLSARQVQ